MGDRLDAFRDSARQATGRAGEHAASTWAGLSTGGRGAVVVGIVAVFAAFAGLIVWAANRNSPPPRADDALAIAHFVASPEFAQLSADQRRPYMQGARKRLPEIAAACREGKIDRRTYRKAYLCSWLERRLEDMQDYYQRPAAKRQAFLESLLDDKGLPQDAVAKAQAKAARAAATTPPAKPAPPKEREEQKEPSDIALLYDDEAERLRFEEKKDAFEDDFLDRWPAERKAQWKQYRSAYTERRKAREAAGLAGAAAGK